MPEDIKSEEKKKIGASFVSMYCDGSELMLQIGKTFWGLYTLEMASLMGRS